MVQPTARKCTALQSLAALETLNKQMHVHKYNFLTFRGMADEERQAALLAVASGQRYLWDVDLRLLTRELQEEGLRKASSPTKQRHDDTCLELQCGLWAVVCALHCNSSSPTEQNGYTMTRALSRLSSLGFGLCRVRVESCKKIRKIMCSLLVTPCARQYGFSGGLSVSLVKAYIY